MSRLSLSDADAMLACAKLFAAYGAAQAGLDCNSVVVSERTLRDIYLPPFKAAFDAGAQCRRRRPGNRRIGESVNMSGEAQSRDKITVPAPQQALAEALAATGKPLVIVLKNGRALALEGAVKVAPAIVVGWFLGSEGGRALADVLLGKASPSGRLPMSFPIASGQEPFHYDRKATDRPNPSGDLLPYKTHYRGIPNEALYPFGHVRPFRRLILAACPGDTRASRAGAKCPKLVDCGLAGSSR